MLKITRVRAVDGDRGIRNKIEYGLSGAQQALFGIDPETGVLYNKVRGDGLVRTYIFFVSFILSIYKIFKVNFGKNIFKNRKGLNLNCLNNKDKFKVCSLIL